MVNYYADVLANLIVDDLIVMEALFKEDAIARHKAIKSHLLQKSLENNMSLAHYRNAIQRLQATCFISTVTLTKEILLYITPYGIKALEDKINKEVRS